MSGFICLSIFFSVYVFTYLYTWMFCCPNAIYGRDNLYSVMLSILFCQRSINYIDVEHFLGSLFCSIHLSFLSQVPHSLDHCRFLSLEDRCCHSVSSLTLLFCFNIELASLDLLPLHINFRICFLYPQNNLLRIWDIFLI